MKYLGLDIGSASIGWCVVERDPVTDQYSILGMGLRPIPYADDSIVSDFQKGKGTTPCGDRTLARGMRRNLDRKQLHRDQLKAILRQYNIMTGNEADAIEPLSPLETWKLRADAAWKTRARLTPQTKVRLTPENFVS